MKPKTTHKLSIIMPCYNCTATLEEAVSSIGTQKLTVPYEVIMVNDGSTDNTLELIKSTAKKYPNISYYSHEKNRGGGAARNTGISKSTGDLIYCLDSDNVFAPDSVQKLVNYISNNNVDGVAFYERRFFVGNNLKKYRSQFSEKLNQPITLNDLFAKKGILLDNFLYTKSSFLKTAGYPENHGFDTQNFELRYISAGFKVEICPDSAFYHRQGAVEKSYFERAYESGEFSINMYLAYEDIFYLFSETTRKNIMSHDIFKNNALNNESIGASMTRLYEKDPELFFIDDYRLYLEPKGFEKYMSNHKNDSKESDIFCSAIYDTKTNNHEQALSKYIDLIKKGLASSVIYYNVLRCLNALSNKDTASVPKKVSELIESMQTRKQSIDLRPGIIARIKTKIKKYLS